MTHKLISLSLLLVLCLALVACGRRGRTETATASETSGAEATAASPQTPEQLDAAYRENARHLVRGGVVWDSPLRSLNAEGLETIRSYRARRGDPETMLTLEVVSPDWIIQRHATSGAVTARVLGAITLARFPDGTCYEYGTSLVQQFVGGDFEGPLTTSGTGGGVVVPCETADAISAARADVAR